MKICQEIPRNSSVNSWKLLKLFVQNFLEYFLRNTCGNFPRNTCNSYFFLEFLSLIILRAFKDFQEFIQNYSRKPSGDSQRFSSSIEGNIGFLSGYFPRKSLGIFIPKIHPTIPSDILPRSFFFFFYVQKFFIESRLNFLLKNTRNFSGNFSINSS